MIADLCARVIMQMAIRGRTLAGDHVMNSPMMALKSVCDAGSSFSPVITVSSGEHESAVTGQDLQGGEALSTLAICVLVPPSARVTYDGAVYEIRGQGPLAAAVSDLIIYQIMQALRDYENPWARLWARMATSVKKFTKSEPYLATDEALSVPARMLSIEYKPLSDPVAGRPMTETFQALYDLMMADAGLRVLAPLIKGAIEDPSGVPDWAYIIMQLGLSDPAATNTGIRPLDPLAPDIAEIAEYQTDPEDDANVIVPDTNEGAV